MTPAGVIGKLSKDWVARGVAALEQSERPAELRERIRMCLGVIHEANRELRDLKECPINICSTPADVPPFTWLPKAEQRRIAALMARRGR